MQKEELTTKEEAAPNSRPITTLSGVAKLPVYLLIILILCSLFGLGGYYIGQQNYFNNKTVQLAQINSVSSLQPRRQQVMPSPTNGASAEQSNPQQTEPSPASGTLDQNLSEDLIFAYNIRTKNAETIAYSNQTGYKLFSKDEVEEIKENYAQPYFDYYNEDETHLSLVIIINKPSLSFRIISDNGGEEEGLHITEYNNKPIWVPSCLGPCEFTSGFKQKHPKTVALSQCVSSYPVRPNECYEAYFED